MDAGTMEVIDQIVLRFSLERLGGCRSSAPPALAADSGSGAPDITLDQLWKGFCTARNGRIKVRTMESYRYSFQVFRRAFPGLLSVGQITDEIAEQYVTLRTAAVRPTTVNSGLRHLRGIWAVAVRKGLAHTNVFAPVANLREPPRTITTVTQEEQERLLETIDGIDRFPLSLRLKLKAIVLIAVQGGLRSEEIRHLRWCDIDLDTGEIRIACREGWSTKNGRNRIAFVLENALHLLRELHADGAAAQEAMPLHYTCRQGPGRDFKLIAQKAGVKCTLHDLRRTCASRMAESGASLLVTTELLGHSSPITTQRYYTNISPPALQRAVRQAQNRQWTGTAGRPRLEVSESMMA